MKIAILYTGGTIGCTGDPLGPLFEEKFKDAFTANMAPIIQSKYKEGCDISFISFGVKTLDSTNLQPSDWCKMARDILSNYSSYDAFIVLHGTDTMAWTASALPFLLTGLDNEGVPNAILTKPVIVTGSQLPLFYEDDASNLSILFNTDAVQNVCGSIAAAYSGIPEVCLYFNNKLFRGNRTVKTNASQFNAFSSPNYPYLGEYGVEFSMENRNLLPFPHRIENKTLDNQEALQNLKDQLDYIKKNIDENESIIIDFQAFPAYYDDTQTPNTSVLSDMLNAYVTTDKVKGIILESYGEGNFPSGNPDKPEEGAIYKTLKTAHDNGIVLVDCTQVLAGIVNSEAYASGSWLSEVGAIGAFDMTPISALAKLIYLTALKDYNNNWTESDIERLMKTNIAGEIMDINKLDSRVKSFLGPGEYIIALDGSAMLINDINKGPILKDKQGTELWSPKPKIPSGTTGRLYMQEDTNLVFYDRSGKPVWATNTGQLGVDAAALVLDTVSSSQDVKDKTKTLTLSIIGTKLGGELYSHIIHRTSTPG